jgi:hypothetical protein
VGDDYTLLDAALRVPLPDLLTGQHGIAGYYRPVSRELYFWTWGKLFGPNPLGFHLVNAVTYAATVAMFHVFLSRWRGGLVATLSTLAFVLFPPTGALLSWISCAQDLIALIWCAAALLLHQSGRGMLAGIATGLAVLSKETAVVLPFVIAAWEWARGAAPAGGPMRTARGLAELPWRSLAGPLAGLAAAVGISVIARSTWPSGTAISVWSPRQVTGAWRVPLDFLSTFLPPGTLEGIATAWRTAPFLLAAVALIAPFAVPVFRRQRAGRPGDARAGATARDRARGQSGAGRDHGLTAVNGGAGRMILFGALVALLGMLPVGFIVERWRGYFYSISALGSSIVLAALLSRLGAWPARALVAAMAVVSLGANSLYRPVEGRGPARHPHVNHVFFKEYATITGQVLGALMPWSPAIRSVPRTFIVGSERNVLLETMTGPALRVSTRDTVARVRFPDAFTPADTAADFGLLRFHPEVLDFTWSPPDAAARLALGEELLLLGRHSLAATSLAAAAHRRPGDADLEYRLVLALAASGHADDARRRWGEAGSRVVSAEELTRRLVAMASVSPDDRAEVSRLAAIVLADPAAASPHATLGRRLLDLGAVRQAAIELSAATGIGGKSRDLVPLADAYAALGMTREAGDRYGRALRLGDLGPALHEHARQRLAAIEAGGAAVP